LEESSNTRLSDPGPFFYFFGIMRMERNRGICDGVEIFLERSKKSPCAHGMGW